MARRSAVRKTPGMQEERDDSYYIASQWQLMWRKFRRHKMAVAAAVMIGGLYLVAVFADFFSVNDYQQRSVDYVLLAPQRVHIFADGRLHAPFVYAVSQELDRSTLTWVYIEDASTRYPIRLFAEGYSYRLLGLIESSIHLIGVGSPGIYFPLGTDALGRDLFSRIVHGSRISLSIGLVGVMASFLLGSIIGGVSGYYGGPADMIIQRVIEFIVSIPTIPLWIALAAALPADWSSVQVYFGITLVLATVGWTQLARTVRGKLLELREADFVMAARVSNMGDFQIIVRHLLPSFASYLIVSLTLAVPGMILSETALSFLGIGIRPPSVSWGVLLQDAQNVRSVAGSPWLLTPSLFVILTVLCFNFVGDGLRDAADPYRQ